MDLPPEFAHLADRPRNPGLRGSERILLTAEAAHEGARFHSDKCLRTQARDHRRSIQLMHLGELPRAELVVRVVPGPVVLYAQDNGCLGVVRCGWSVCSRLARLIARCLRPKGTKPAVSFPGTFSSLPRKTVRCQS